jgi:hypothetical protein
MFGSSGYLGYMNISVCFEDGEDIVLTGRSGFGGLIPFDNGTLCIAETSTSSSEL